MFLRNKIIQKDFLFLKMVYLKRLVLNYDENAGKKLNNPLLLYLEIFVKLST